MRHLPKWLKVDINYNTIIIYGIPKTNDIPKLYIQVYSEDIIIMEYLLEIVEKIEMKAYIDQRLEKDDEIGNVLKYN